MPGRSNSGRDQDLRNILGKHDCTYPNYQICVTAHLKRSDGDAIVHKYAIVGIKQILSPKMVASHPMPYALLTPQ